MLWPAVSVFGVFLILVIAEYASRTRRAIHSELTRKFVHMSVGTFVATWPFYFKWWEIGLVSLAFLFVVSVSIQWNIFRSIHGVNRRSLGEVLFAVAIGFLAFLDGDPWVFTIAMLHLSLADGFAAIVGVHFGKRTRYQVFGYPKSWAGTLTFLGVSVFITGFYVVGVMATPDLTLLLLVPLIATLVENFSIYGTDNLFVPVVVAGMLKFL